MRRNNQLNMLETTAKGLIKHNTKGSKVQIDESTEYIYAYYQIWCDSLLDNLRGPKIPW